MQYAGEYILNELFIMAPSGKTEDLTGSVLNFNIYEDIFVNALYGDITGQSEFKLNLRPPGLFFQSLIRFGVSATPVAVFLQSRPLLSYIPEDYVFSKY